MTSYNFLLSEARRDLKKTQKKFKLQSIERKLYLDKLNKTVENNQNWNILNHCSNNFNIKNYYASSKQAEKSFAIMNKEEHLLK